MVAQNSEQNEIFQMNLNILPKLWLIFYRHKQWPTPWVNIARQINSFFSSFWVLLGVIFHFSASRPPKFISLGFRLCIMFWSVKYTFTCQNDTFKPFNIISSYRKVANFWYITCFVPNFIPIWPWSHRLIMIAVKKWNGNNVFNVTLVDLPSLPYHVKT